METSQNCWSIGLQQFTFVAVDFLDWSARFSLLVTRIKVAQNYVRLRA